jgi:hypothetical protein
MEGYISEHSVHERDTRVRKIFERKCKDVKGKSIEQGMHGIQEVVGSIRISSTIFFYGLALTSLTPLPSALIKL